MELLLILEGVSPSCVGAASEVGTSLRGSLEPGYTGGGGVGGGGGGWPGGELVAAGGRSLPRRVDVESSAR